jgi:CRP-like cAMP-binding protein
MTAQSANGRPAEPQDGFWAALDPGERNALRASGTWLQLPSGHVIFEQHEESDHVVVIWAGHAKVLSRSDGREVVLALRGPGEIVGEMVNVGGGARSAAVVAIERVVALKVEGTRFAEFLRQHAHASKLLTQLLVERLREADEYRLVAGSFSLGQRLARLLLQLADRYGLPTESGGIRIAIPLSQKDLAAWVGGSHRTVAREIERWRERGIVSTGRRRIVILQTEVLKRIAGLREGGRDGGAA